MKTALNYIRVSKRAPLYLLAWQMGGFCLGMAFVLVINRFFNEDQDFFLMGTAFSVLFGLVGVLARGAGTNGLRLRMAVSMGQTRRMYLWINTLISVVLVLAVFFVSRLLNAAELALYQRLYPGYENAFQSDILFSWPVLLLLGECIIALDTFFTMIIQRFGNRLFSSIWVGLWAVILIMSQCVDAYKEGGTSVMSAVGGWIVTVSGMFTWQGWVGIGYGMLAAIFAAGIIGLRDVEIKF